MSNEIVHRVWARVRVDVRTTSLVSNLISMADDVPIRRLSAWSNLNMPERVVPALFLPKRKSAASPLVLVDSMYWCTLVLDEERCNI